MIENLILRKNERHRSVILHTLATHGPNFFYSNIDAAIWLLSRDKTISSVDIVLHPVRFKYSIDDAIITARYLIKKTPRELLRLFWKHAKPKIFIKNKISRDPSIYEQVYAGREPVVLETELGIIRCRRSVEHVLPFTFDLIQSTDIAADLLRSCYEDQELDPQKLLRLEYQGIVIGDLVASDALRFYPKAAGSLRNCSITGIRHTLRRAITICDYIKTNIKIEPDYAYVMVSEPTYLDAIYRRILHKHGAYVIDNYGYAKEFNLISQTEPLYNLSIIQKREIQSLTMDQVVNIKSYLHNRLHKPKEALWYMETGANSTESDLLDGENNLIELAECGLSVVIFLHSFDDGQYYYGVDDFDDLYHWTVFTIDELLKNPDVSMILIKPHPNVAINANRYLGDKIAHHKIVSRYKRNEGRVRWIKMDCGPLALAGKRNIIGITHHGSVAEELTFLGIPVIASTFAPWGNAYFFTHNWQSKSEYLQIIKGLSCANCLACTKNMMDDLFKFILQYRLNVPTMAERVTYKKFGMYADGIEPSADDATWNLFGRRLGQLNSKDPLLMHFLEHLVGLHRPIK